MLKKAARRIAELLEEDRVDVQMDEVKCVMICEALIEAVGNHKKKSRD